MVEGGEKIYLRLLLKPLSGGTSCWDDRPPKKSKFEGEPFVHALRVERESINTVAGRNVTVYRGTKQTCLYLVRVDVAQTLWSASTPRLDKDG